MPAAANRRAATTPARRCVSGRVLELDGKRSPGAVLDRLAGADQRPLRLAGPGARTAHMRGSSISDSEGRSMIPHGYGRSLRSVGRPVGRLLKATGRHRAAGAYPFRRVGRRLRAGDDAPFDRIRTPICERCGVRGLRIRSVCDFIRHEDADPEAGKIASSRSSNRPFDFRMHTRGRGEATVMERSRRLARSAPAPNRHRGVAPRQTRRFLRVARSASCGPPCPTSPRPHHAL